MTILLIDRLHEAITPGLAVRLASSLGEPIQNVNAGLKCGVESMLLATLSKSDDTSAMLSIFGLITDNANDGRVLDDPAALVGSSADAPMATLGRQYLAVIFGTRAAAVNSLLSDQLKLRFGSVASLMQLAAPLVLGVLGKRVRDGKLTQETFKTLLQEESSSIQRAAPTGLTETLGTEHPEWVFQPSEQSLERVETAQGSSSTSRGGRKWLWPVAIAGGLALAWAFTRRDRGPEVALKDTGRTSVAAGDVAASPARPGMKMLILPDGKTIEVPEASSEAKIVGFLTDDSRATDNTSWFALDALYFPAHSTTLRPEGKAQIQRLAQIMKAYPTSEVTIAGFTDNVGPDARNQRLSRARAEHARDLLIREGVEASRITANGYGSALPRAENSTDSGRAQNRRIALLFVKK